jgi:hypothetical protein
VKSDWSIQLPNVCDAFRPLRAIPCGNILCGDSGFRPFR